MDSQHGQSPFPNQTRLGTGVFQYHDITHSAHPHDNHTYNNFQNQDNVRSHNPTITENTMEIPIANRPANHIGENPDNSTGNGSSENLQPDSEPEAITGESNPASTDERGELQP